MTESETIPRPGADEVRSWIGDRLDELAGANVGKIDGVFVDAESGEPEWIVVRMGRFGHHTLIPARDAVAGVKRVWVPYTRDQIRQAPKADPGSLADGRRRARPARPLRDHGRRRARRRDRHARRRRRHREARLTRELVPRRIFASFAAFPSRWGLVPSVASCLDSQSQRQLIPGGECYDRAGRPLAPVGSGPQTSSIARPWWSRSASAGSTAKPHELSPKARRFAEALSFTEGCSGLPTRGTGGPPEDAAGGVIRRPCAC